MYKAVAKPIFCENKRRYPSKNFWYLPEALIKFHAEIYRSNNLSIPTSTNFDSTLLLEQRQTTEQTGLPNFVTSLKQLLNNLTASQPSTFCYVYLM